MCADVNVKKKNKSNTAAGLPQLLKYLVEQRVLFTHKCIDRHGTKLNKKYSHNLLPPLHETSGETRVFNLPKPRVPSQYVYLLVCVSVGTTERYFSMVKCDVSTRVMFLIEMF